MLRSTEAADIDETDGNAFISDALSDAIVFAFDALED